MPKVGTEHKVSSPELRPTLWRCHKCVSLISIYSIEDIDCAICPICCDVTMDSFRELRVHLGHGIAVMIRVVSSAIVAVDARSAVVARCILQEQ